MKPIISVIIPVYNIQNYIEKCLFSIENQRVFNKLEIILVNDGSEDNSGIICENFASKYKNVKVIHQKNEGVSNARNHGMKISTGEYISFVDGDDYLENNHFEEMIDDIKKTDADLIIHDYMVEFTNSTYQYRQKNKSENFSHETAIKELLSGGIIGNNLFDKVFKNEQTKNIYFDSKIKIGEDLLFIYQFLLKCNNISYRAIPTYHYVQRSGSAMNSLFSEKYFDIIKVAEIIEKSIKENFPTFSKYAEALTIYSKYKTLERAYKMNGFQNYSERLNKLNNDIKRYSIKDAIQFMSKKKMIGLALYKISPKLYLAVCKIKKI